jgi:RES domain-containing protein
MLQVPRALHTIDVQTLRVLDLRGDEALDYVGLSSQDITDDDWTACQTVGHAAYFLDMQGVVAPSATGGGIVLAVFESRVGPGQVSLAQTVELDVSTYHAAHDA